MAPKQNVKVFTTAAATLKVDKLLQKVAARAIKRNL